MSRRRESRDPRGGARRRLPAVRLPPGARAERLLRLGRQRRARRDRGGRGRDATRLETVSRAAADSERSASQAADPGAVDSSGSIPQRFEAVRDSTQQRGGSETTARDAARHRHLRCPASEEVLEAGDRQPPLSLHQLHALRSTRLTIIHSLPYDRPGTSMQAFTMCDACRTPSTRIRLNRRFHAQPNACPDCGPRNLLPGLERCAIVASPAQESLERRRPTNVERGAIVAVKGLGGFHLMADAGNAEALQPLARGETATREALRIDGARSGAGPRPLRRSTTRPRGFSVRLPRRSCFLPRRAAARWWTICRRAG